MPPPRWMTSLFRAPRTPAAPAPRAKFWSELLEDRAVLSAIATGAAPGEAPIVRVFDAATGAPTATIPAYDATFAGGVNVALADVTGDGTADVITGTASGAAHVKVFDGVTFREVRSFLTFDGFAGGVNVAAGDLNGDRLADIVVSVAGGAAPHVKAFSGADGSELASFLAFDAPFTGGVRVAVGDVDGDGKADIVAGSGPGADGHVKVFGGTTGALLHSFIAFEGFTGGVNVAAGDLDGDGRADLVVGAAGGSGGHVKAFDGATGEPEVSFLAFDAGFTGGVQVGVGPDANGDGAGDLTVGAVGTGHVKTFDPAGRLLSSTVVPGTATGGVGITPAPAPAPAPPPTNAAPVLAPVGPKTGPALQPIAFTLAATDPDAGAALTFSATGLPAGATLNPATGAFAWTPSLDQSGTFTVTFRVTDGQTTDEEAVTFTVAGVNVAPVITSNGGGPTAQVSVPENTTAVTAVTAADANAGATLTYSIVPTAGGGAADAALFAIDAATGVLTFLAAPDHENPADAGANGVYDVTVRVTDGALSATQTLAVIVGNVNEAPLLAPQGEGSLAENTTSAGSVVAPDPEGGEVTYSIVGGADAARFTIDPATGALTFDGNPDFEAPADANGDNVYEVQVQASDGTLTATQTRTITVLNANEAPAVTAPTSTAVAEGQTAVLTVGGTDPDAGSTLTFSIVGGADAARFSINPATGALTFVSAPDFEAPADADENNTYLVEVQVSDGSLTGSQTIAVTVTDVNEAPTITSDGGGPAAGVNVAEGATAVTTVTATDPDAGAALTYSILGGADQGKFVIDPTTGVLSFDAPPDFEIPDDLDNDNVYEVTVQVSDGALTDTQAISVTVTQSP